MPDLRPIRSDKDVEDALARLLATDPRLEPVAKIAGPLPLRLQQPGFPGLARIIIGQHVSTASASAIYGRFLEEITPVSPQAFLSAGEESWIRIGLTRAKQTALENLSGQLIEGAFDLERIVNLPASEAVSEMVKQKGIGPWTAEVYLLFCAGHPDIFAAGDLALREAVRHAFGMAERPTEKELRELVKRWVPHRAVAARLFWTYYEKIRGTGKGTPL